MYSFSTAFFYTKCVCTLPNAEYLKAGLDKLELFLVFQSHNRGSSMDEINRVRQAVGILVTKQKSKITYGSKYPTTLLCTLYLNDKRRYTYCCTRSKDLKKELKN